MKQIRKVKNTSQETSGYELPIASSETLGGIKVGANLTIDEEGVLSATGGSSLKVYSTEEQIVGTWLGVPLYRKTIITTTHSKANTDTEIGSLPEAKEVVKVNGYWRSLGEGNGHNLYINTYYNSNDHIDVFFYKETRKLFAIGGSNYLNKTLFLTIEYIKEVPTINE